MPTLLPHGVLQMSLNSTLIVVSNKRHRQEEQITWKLETSAKLTHEMSHTGLPPRALFCEGLKPSGPCECIRVGAQHIHPGKYACPQRRLDEQTL